MEACLPAKIKRLFGKRLGHRLHPRRLIGRLRKTINISVFSGELHEIPHTVDTLAAWIQFWRPKPGCSLPGFQCKNVYRNVFNPS